MIKVEPPGHGDDTRGYGPFYKGQSLYFSSINRGKESIVLNLKDEADRDIFRNMVRKADVVAENFRPGVMARLGFAYEELSRLNPRLIYASSSGFGQTGPLSTYPAYDTIIQAMSGIAMFDSAFAFLEHGGMEYLAIGEAPARIGNRHPSIAPFDVFESSDGQVIICCGNDHLFNRLCRTIGRPELITDKRFQGNDDRLENNLALKLELEVTLKRKPAAHWLETIHEAGVPIGPLLNVADAAEHPQISARNMVIEAGDLRMPGNPVKISGYDDPHVRIGAPALDQHRAALRREFRQSHNRDEAGIAPPSTAPGVLA